MRAFIHTALLLSISSASFYPQGSKDSTSGKLPRHYFNTVIGLDLYRKPKKDISANTQALSSRLGSYGVKQTIASFYTPLATREFVRDSVTKGNTHLLLTGNFMSLRPVFSGLRNQHTLVKAGVGIRYVYNSGKKAVLFIDVSPFVTRDITFRSRPYYRVASTIVYSHNPSLFFNWRAGITKSFIWGNRYYLPFIGLRVGRLDRINLSLQFPRSITVSVPVNHRLLLSVYTRPQGGVFNFSNRDSLYFSYSAATFHFARYEINTGMRIDARIGARFNFFAAAGLSTRNNVTFYSENANRRQRVNRYNVYFYSKDIPPSGFLELGFVLKLGNSRSYYYNKNLYDAADMNNVLDRNGNVQIPLAPKKQSDKNLESIEDLVDYNDF